MRLFERAMRRAGLPLKMSEGFNPRPQLSFPVALALGVESRCEIVEAEMTEWVSPRRVKESLAARMPEGIGIVSVQSVGYGEKAEVVGTEFSVEMGTVPDDLSSRLAGFLNSSEAYVERAGKSGAKRVNVRCYVKDARLDGKTLTMSLSVSPAGSVRPEEVLEAVLGGPFRALAPLAVTRTRLDFKPPA